MSKWIEQKEFHHRQDKHLSGDSAWAANISEHAAIDEFPCKEGLPRHQNCVELGAVDLPSRLGSHSREEFMHAGLKSNAALVLWAGFLWGLRSSIRGCYPESNETLGDFASRADHGFYWKSTLRPHWPDFLIHSRPLCGRRSTHAVFHVEFVATGG